MACSVRDLDCRHSLFNTRRFVVANTTRSFGIIAIEFGSQSCRFRDCAAIARKAEGIRQELRADAFGALGVVVLPSLAALLVGFIPGWIGRGFSHRPRHT